MTTSRHVACGVLAMSLVGSSVAVSQVLVSAPLFAAQAVRYAAASGILLLAARLVGISFVRPRGMEWAWLAGIAATGLVLFNVAVVRGVAHAEPAVIAVAVACVPVLLGIVGPLLEGRSPRRRIVIAAIVVTLGSVFVEGAGHTDAVGVAWATVALLCEASFTLLAVPVLPRHGAWGVSVHSVWMGAVMFAVVAFSAEGSSAVRSLTAADWGAIAYLAALVTAAAFILWYSTVAALGAGRVGLLTGVAPICAALAGIVTGSRAPRLGVWAGMAVVVVGLAVGLVDGVEPRPQAHGHTAWMRLTDFWDRMRQQFGETYADSFARDFVMSELGGRTIHQALAEGVDAGEVWRAVCRTVDVPPKLR